MSGGLVCGFWDEGAGVAGLGWRLGERAGGLLLSGERAEPAEAEIQEEAQVAVALRLRGGQTEAEAELRPGAGVPLTGPAAEPDGSADSGGIESARCAAEISFEGRAREVAGHLTRWASDPLQGTGVFRHLALPAADQALLLVLSRGEAGAAEWGSEDSSAWLLGLEGGARSYPDAWLSTQYGPGGGQTRAGMELWSRDDGVPPMRAAGTQLGGVPEPRDGVSAAILSTSAEGSTGLGSYLIWRE